MEITKEEACAMIRLIDCFLDRLGPYESIGKDVADYRDTIRIKLLMDIGKDEETTK